MFGTPERSLEQAYQAALSIKSIEDRYFHGGKVTASAANNAQLPASVQADFEKHLSILKQQMKEFNTSSSTQGNLGQDHLMRLFFTEGTLTKYTLEPQSSAALVPFSTNFPSNTSSQLPTPPIQVIEVKQAIAPEKTRARQLHRKNSRNSAPENAEPQVKAGVLPRSLERTINKIKNELDPNAEAEVVKSFRRSQKKTVVAIRLLALLILIPLITQQVSKLYLVQPIVERVRNEAVTPVFLNSEMKEEALKELQTFEEELKLERLMGAAPALTSEAIEEKVKDKATEISQEFRHRSNNAVSNVFADIIAVLSFALVLLWRRKDIMMLKSFMDNIVTGLSDSAKAFSIILITDIFVGFHSPHGWEVLLEGLSSHLGIAANRGVIFLFIATVPVILATIFKYWVFRSLSRMSPSTVATLKEMND
ncbi:MAG: proton extrusion protein PcxA [Chroococcidiopsis sp.]